MNDASLRSHQPDLPAGVTSLEITATGLPIAGVCWETVEAELAAGPGRLAERILDGGLRAVALDMSGLTFPSPDQAAAVAGFVDELQLRGTSVVLISVSPGFLTAACLDGDDVRFAVERDLEAAVAILDQYDRMRRRCTSSEGRRINQLRMPARTLSVPSLCAFVRDRLEQGGVRGEVLFGMMRGFYGAVTETLRRCGPEAADLSASATVHDGRATVTLLDGGPCPEGPVPDPEHCHRVHRFRVLDRHNALVLERDLSGPAVAGSGAQSVS